jgi:hypothetical protein
MPINYVSNMLGHSNLSTTSRYLNINRRGLHLAMQKFEAQRQEKNSRRADAGTAGRSRLAQALPKTEKTAQAVVQHTPVLKGRESTVQ